MQLRFCGALRFAALRFASVMRFASLSCSFAASAVSTGLLNCASVILPSMHANEKLINDFYEAFRRGDGETMAASYHQDATFRDPVFPKLNREEVGAMWRMFCSGEVEVSVEYSGISCSESSGQGHWEARYPFRTTGRPVHNCIDARFTFKDGKILSHVDSFPFWKWTRMALGTSGLLLGWTPLLRKKVQSLAKKSLVDSMAKQNS